MGAPFDQDDFEFADWHRAYHAAVLETDRVKVLRLVQAAEDAIFKRERCTLCASDTHWTKGLETRNYSTLAHLLDRGTGLP
jgi:hypothetical protein